MIFVCDPLACQVLMLRFLTLRQSPFGLGSLPCENFHKVPLLSISVLVYCFGSTELILDCRTFLYGDSSRCNKFLIDYYILCFRSARSLTIFCPPPWEMKCWRSCLCRSRHELDKGLDSRWQKHNIIVACHIESFVYIWNANSNWQMPNICTTISNSCH